MTIGETIKSIREREGLSINQVGRLIDPDNAESQTAHVSKVERGGDKVAYTSIVKILDAMGYDVVIVKRGEK